MRTLLFCLLICASALPAVAGQWSIVETDDAYIVEYTGDASDKPANLPRAGRQDLPATAPKGSLNGTPGTPTATAPPPPPPSTPAKPEGPSRGWMKRRMYRGATEAGGSQ